MFLVLAFSIFVSSSYTVYGASVFLTPSSITLEDVYYYGYAKTNITISTDSESDIACAVTIHGDISDVVSLSDNICVINQDSSITLRMIARPKGKTGMIAGSIRVTVLSAEPLTTTTDYFDMPVIVNSVTRKIIQNEITEVVVSDTEVNVPTDISVSYDNKGNVELYPKTHIEIFSGNKIKSNRFSNELRRTGNN